MSLKKCSKCRKRLNRRNFNKDRGKKDGCFSWCRTCSKKRGKQYNTPERKKIKMNYWYQRIYHITSAERQQMLIWQNHRCAICRMKENGKKLHVDHNHETEKIRMLLCDGCNTGTKITDNIILLLAKAEYLKVYMS